MKPGDLVEILLPKFLISPTLALIIKEQPGTGLLLVLTPDGKISRYSASVLRKVIDETR